MVRPVESGWPFSSLSFSSFSAGFNHAPSGNLAKGKVMFLASKIGWVGIALALLTTGMSLPAFPQREVGDSSKRQGVPAFVIKNEIRKMQETLRDKGHFRGKIDGVFGLRTRASIRAYQKGENLPITGEVDARTAAGLGVRPESTWAGYKSVEAQDGRRRGSVAGEFKREKPSAGIRQAKGNPSQASGRKPQGLQRWMTTAEEALITNRLGMQYTTSSSVFAICSSKNFLKKTGDVTEQHILPFSSAVPW